MHSVHEPSSHEAIAPDRDNDGILPIGPFNLIDESRFRRFYDPTDFFAGRPVNELVSEVVVTRRPIDLPTMGYLGGHAVLLAEATHGLLGSGQGIELPLSQSQQADIITAIHRHADRVSDAVIDASKDAIDRYYFLRKTREDGQSSNPPSELVTTGKILAAVAHDGVTRRSGRAYYRHPDEVATITGIAWQLQMEQERSPELRNMQFLNYVHDAFEDSIDNDTSFLGVPRLIASPLVARMILAKLDIEPAGITDAFMLLTRTSSPHGKLPYNEIYIPTGIREGGYPFVIPKSADVHHNDVIEPSVYTVYDQKVREKELAKRAQYQTAKAQLQRAADSFDDFELALVVDRIFQVTRERVRQGAARRPNVLIEVAAKRLMADQTLLL